MVLEGACIMLDSGLHGFELARWVHVLDVKADDGYTVFAYVELLEFAFEVEAVLDGVLAVSDRRDFGLTCRLAC